MTDTFEESEFNTGESSASADQHFESRHDPTLGWTHIQKSIASLDAGLDGFSTDEQRDNAKIYANVAVFRETMQYAEEFGIYLYSRLDPVVDFIEAFTGTRPDNVKEIFTTIREDGFEEVTQEYADESADEWLKGQLGYNTINQEETTLEELLDEDTELTVDSVDEAISESLSSVKQKLDKISRFFLQFDEAYNAVKHGTRVTPMSGFHAKLETGNDEAEIDIDEPFVTFLAKESGEQSSGQPFTFIAPVEILREQSVAIAGVVHDLYTHIYDIDQALKESESKDSSVTLSAHFYSIAADGKEDSSYQMKDIRNSDATIWIPEQKFPDSFEKRSGPITGQIAVAFEKHGNDFVVKTEGDSSTSYDYPISMEGTFTNNPDALIGGLSQHTYQFKLWQLPIWQLLELLALKESGSFDTVKIEIVDQGESVTQHLTEPIETPGIPEPTILDELEFMHRVGLATDTDLYVPITVNEEALETIQNYMGEDLTRETAEECLEEVKKATKEVVVTRPIVAILDPSQPTDHGYESIQQSGLDVFEGSLIREWDDEVGDAKFSIVSGSDDRYELDPETEVVNLGLGKIQLDSDEAYQRICQDGVEAITELPFAESRHKAESFVELSRQPGEKSIWDQMDILQITIYDEFPPHLE